MTGIKDQNIRGEGVINSAESGTITPGCAMQRETDGTLKIWNAGNYCGTACMLPGTAAGADTAVKGDTIGLDHHGVREVIDSEDDTLVLDEPLMPTGTAGKFRKWASGVNGAELLAGYLERTKDADKKILMRLVGGR